MTQYIIITGSGYFGKGSTLEVALANVLKAGARRSHAGTVVIATGLKEGEAVEISGLHIRYPEQCVDHVTTINLRTIGSIVTNYRER